MPRRHCILLHCRARCPVQPDRDGLAALPPRSGAKLHQVVIPSGRPYTHEAQLESLLRAANAHVVVDIAGRMNIATPRWHPFKQAAL